MLATAASGICTSGANAGRALPDQAGQQKQKHYMLDMLQHAEPLWLLHHMVLASDATL
jgi:hypothetical protein